MNVKGHVLWKKHAGYVFVFLMQLYRRTGKWRELGRGAGQSWSQLGWVQCSS